MTIPCQPKAVAHIEALSTYVDRVVGVGFVPSGEEKISDLHSTTLAFPEALLLAGRPKSPVGVSRPGLVDDEMEGATIVADPGDRA